MNTDDTAGRSQTPAPDGAPSAHEDPRATYAASTDGTVEATEGGWASPGHQPSDPQTSDPQTSDPQSSDPTAELPADTAAATYPEQPSYAAPPTAQPTAPQPAYAAYPPPAAPQYPMGQPAPQYPAGQYPQTYPGPYATPPGGAGTMPPPNSGKHGTMVHRSLALRFSAAALIVGLAAGGAGAAVIGRATGGSSNDQSTASTVQLPQTQQGGSDGSTQQNPWSGGFGFPDQGSGQSGSTQEGTGATDYSAATAKQQVGVVTITSTLGYESGESAGTGMILTSDGEVLTNNHVINGATAVKVTVETTGRTYDATVVGTDVTHDIALLHLSDASGLTAVDTDTSAVATGTAVTAIGNAEGTGDLVAAAGTVTATAQQITTSSENGTAGETLTNLIQVDADVVSGDSGGPLVASDGDVVGITTAASSGTADVTGFAIPIADALKVVDQIRSGDESGTVTLGLPAFLGVQLSSSSTPGYGTSDVTGAVIAGVIENTPAANAGLASGDVITKVDGKTITSADDLTSAMAGKDPGDKTKITWTTSTGSTQTGTVTLIEGPAA